MKTPQPLRSALRTSLGLIACQWSFVVTSADTVLTSDRDTYIRSNQATTNFGSDAFMVANENATSVRMAIFRFDLSSVSGVITGAKLEVDDVIGGYSGSFEVWGLLDAHEDFDEGTLTWNTATFVDGADYSTVDSSKAYGGTLLGTFANTANSVNTVFDVTSGNYIDFLNASADDIVTFVIVDPINSTPGSGWATKEAGSGDLKPTLTIVPEPGVAFLGSIGLLALLRRRR